MIFEWQKLGKIIGPQKNISWMNSHTGAAYSCQRKGSSLFDIYLTARQKNNVSRIGLITIDIKNPTKVLNVSKNPVISLGDRGSFDETGTSYPCIVKKNKQTYLFYTGWLPGKTVPFHNGLGLAKLKNDSFSKVSLSPILPLNNEDHLSIGSACILIERNLWKMWYTSFLSWGDKKYEPKHRYLIKYAYSYDGIRWERDNTTCISFANRKEYAICRPSVIKINDAYHMWFCHKGSNYEIGYAFSVDGINWKRSDKNAGISRSKIGWDSISMCYPHIFNYKKDHFLIYGGNDYGNAGIGIAKLKR